MRGWYVAGEWRDPAVSVYGTHVLRGEFRFCTHEVQVKVTLLTSANDSRHL
jgi:hypothetical protein